MREITIEIDKLGGAEIETTGYTGAACADATKEIEQALGRVTNDTKKAEYYAKAKTGQQLGQR